MRRRTQANPMRMLVMLAVMWAAGSWLFAAESSPPARATQPVAAQTEPAAKSESQPAAQAGATEAGAAKDEKAAADGKTAASEKAAAGEKADSEEKADVEADANDALAEATGETKTDSKDAASGNSASAADKGASPRRFVPSEQVRADFDVSFPIDI